MNRTFYAALVGCCASLFCAAPVFAQAAYTDTIARQNQIDNAIAGFSASIGDQSRLYNGPEYYLYDHLIKGTANLNEASGFVNGTVAYDGFTYKNVPMLYDMYKDLLAMQLPGKLANVALLSERVQSFDLLNHHFVHLEAFAAKNSDDIAAGFYDELYSGKSQLLIKREKTIQTNTSATIDSYFTPASNKMYVWANGVYKGFGSEGSLLGALKDKRKELKQYIRDNNLKFKNDKEQDAAKVISYYDQLTTKI